MRACVISLAWSLFCLASDKAWAQFFQITSPTTATAAAGSYFFYQITTSSPAISYSMSGQPDSLFFDPMTGMLSGFAPSTPGVFSISISAFNGMNTAFGFLTLTVGPPDTTPPVITLIGSNPMTVIRSSSFTDPGANVTDNIDPPRTVLGTGTVNTSVLGSYVLTYSATDAAGNSAVPMTRTVNVTNSTNANLSALALGNGFLSPTFSSNTTNYTASVSNSVSSTTVRPTAAQTNATIQVRVNSGNFTNVASGAFSSALPLNPGANPIDVRVTAQDGTTTKTYTVTVTRAASANADLSALSLSAGTLAPTFATSTTNYTASVPNNVSSITVTPTLVQANATAQVRVNGGAFANVASGNASSALALAFGSNTIDVRITAQDGTTTKTYAVTVTRTASTNADLSTLSLSAGTLAPTFATNTTNYTATVANTVSSVTVTPTVADTTATVKVNGTDVVSGAASSAINLNVGSNTITVAVTAQNGTVKNYTVSVARAANSAPTISLLPDSTIDEDSSVSLAFTIGDAETPAQSLTLGVSAADTSLVPTANVVLGGSDTSRTITATPTPDKNGATTVTVSVGDGTTTTTRSFNLTVRAVNDPPLFTPGADIAVNEDCGAQTVAAWATNIAPGPPTATDESAQTVAFEVTQNTSPSLFSVQPSLAANGTLSFTPATNAFGTATIAVRARDNGGSSPGVDTSAERTLKITVNAVNDTPVATPQTVTTPQGTPLAITLNATDVENDSAALSIVSPPSNGTISAITYPGGPFGPMRLIYMPRAGFSGSDSFTFRGTDTQPGTPAVVNINVTAVADPSAERLRQGLQLQSAPSKSWKLNWNAANGAEYLVQRSTDLRTWTDAPNGRVTANTNTVSFTDTSLDPSTRSVFWRVKLLGSADVAPPVVAGVNARIIALPDGSRAMEFSVGAADDRQVVGVTLMDGANIVGEGVFSPVDGLWKLNVQVPSDSLASRTFKVVARDARENRSEEFAQSLGLFNPSRFAPIGQDGKALRGQVVAAGESGQWSPFEYRAGGGGARGVGADLIIKFPNGARLVDTPSGPAFEFSAASAQFGPSSPLQLRSPLQRTSGTARLPLGTLNVEDLRTAFGVTGEPGLDVVMNGRAPLRWLGGELKPEGITDPVFAPSASLGWPLPARSTSYTGQNLDWADSTVRLPFSGEFALGTASDAPVLEVPSANPLWLELRGDGSVALRGNARMRLPGGSSIGVEVIADDPIYHLRVRAEGFEIPLADTLADLIPDNPQNSIPPDSGNSTERDLALDNYAQGLTSQRRGYGQFIATASALDPRLPGTNSAVIPVLPADEVGAVSSMLDAWLHLGPGAAVPANAVAPLVALADRLQNSVGFDRDLGSAARLANALAQLRVVLSQNADTTVAAVRERIAAALPAILEAARLRANDPQMLVDLPTLEDVTRDLLLTAQAADAAQLEAEATALRETLRSMIARYAEDFCRRLGVTANQYEPNSAVNALGAAELEEKISLLVRINALVAKDLEHRIGSLWEIGTAPLNEAGTQLAVALSRKLDTMLAAAEQTSDINAFLDAAAVKTALVTQRQLAALPDTPAATVALDAVGLTMPALQTLVGTRGTAVVTADLAQPVEQRSWYDVGRSLERWAKVFAEAPPSLTFSGSVLSVPHRAFQQKADEAFGVLSAMGIAGDLGRLLRAGTLDARLMRQFPTVLTSTTAWESPTRLAAVAAKLREVAVPAGNHSELLLAAQLMLDEADTLEAEATKTGLSEADRITRQQTRRIYLQQAALFLDSLRDVSRSLWAASKSARAATPGITTDMLLPGNVKIREVRGAFSFNRITGAFRGSVGGKADLPGFFAGSQLEIVNASFTSGGAYEVSIAGSVNIPANPVTDKDKVGIRKVSIPARRPITIGHTPGQPLRVAGSTLVELSNGVFFEGTLSLQDPVYTFGLATGGARFELAKEIHGYTTTINLDRPLRELGETTLRSLTDYQRSFGAAFDPLLELAAAPVNIPALGQTPEFAPPELSFDGAALQAWASGLKSEFGRATQAGFTEMSSALVADLAKAVSDSKRQPPGLLDNLSFYLQTLRRAYDLEFKAITARFWLKAAADSEALPWAPPESIHLVTQETFRQVHELIGEMTKQIEPLLQQGSVVSDTELAARVVRLALDTEALAQLTGAPNSTGLQNKVAPFLKATVGGLLATMGFNRETGQLENTQKFGSLSLYELRDATKRLMRIETDLQLLGDGMILPEDKDDPAKLKRTSPPPNPYAQATALILRAYRERLVQAWFAIEDPSNFAEYRQIASELTDWAARVPALTDTVPPTGNGLPVMTGLTPLTAGAPPMNSNDQGALFQDLVNQAAGLAASQRLDARARAEDPLYPLLLEWRRLSNAQFAPEVLAATERELRRNFEDLLPSLLGWEPTQPGSAALPAGAGALPTATTILGNLLQIAEAADAFNFQSFLEGVVLPQLPSFNLKFQALAGAQKAWWETSNYGGLLLDAYGKRNTQVASALNSALENSLRETLKTGRGIAQSIAELRADEVRNPFDIKLPGDIIVRRVGGEFTFNRETQTFLAKLGGELEFPEFKSNNKPLLLATEGTLNSDGRLTLGIDVRDLRINEDDNVRLDLKGALALQTDGNITMDSGSGASKLYVRNRNPGRQTGEPEFYEYAGTLAYERGSNGNPGRFAVTGTGTQPLVFDKNFAVFSPNLAMEFIGEADGKLAVGGDLALWSAGRDYAPIGPSSTDYQLVFGGGAMEFGYDASGFALALRRASVSPNLRLALAPSLFGQFATPVVDSAPVPDKPANAPLTQITFGGNPEFRLRYDYGSQGQDGTVRFTALPPDALTVQNFGFAVPGVPDFALAVMRADLELPMESTNLRSQRTTQRTLPVLKQLDARLRVPLPDSLQGAKRKAEVRISGKEWGLDGRPPAGAEVALDQQGPLHLFNETGVIVSLEPDPGLTPPLGLGFTSEAVGNNQRTTVTLSGKIRLTLADGIISNDTTGQSVSGALGGKLGLAVVVRPDGSVDSISPVAELGTLEVTGRFRLGDGSNGLLVRGVGGANDQATLSFGGLGNLLNLSANKPFTISLTGAAEVPGLFAFSLNNASLKFIGPGGPLFGVTEAALAAPPGGNLLQLLQGTSDANLMPLTISKVGFGLNNPSLAVTNGAFAPTNLKFILSGGLRLNLPGFDAEGSTAPSIKGDVADLAVSFPNGFTNLPSVSANMVRLTLENLAIGDMAGITGGLAVANLTDPANLLIAGEAGASFNGAGIKLLIAAGRDGLIGVCLSADARPAGIPIDGGTLGGVLLTGAEGGIKFRGGASDPTEFESYLSFASDGTPSYRPPAPAGRSVRRVATVSDAVAISWEELALLQAQHEAARATGSTEGLIQTQVAAPRMAKAMSTASTNDPYDCNLGPCPPTRPPDEDNDAVTIKLSGTFSHAAVSTVLTLTGGMLGSTDGTFAADGSMNLIGVPFGTAQMWFSPNLDSNGIPNPSLCGNAFVGLGPLQIGQMDFLADGNGILPGVVEALGNFAGGLGNSSGMRTFIYDLIDNSRGFAVNAAGQLVAKSPIDRSRPLTNYLGPGASLTPEEQMAVMTGILNVPNLLASAPSRLPASARNEIVNQAKELVFALNEAVAPRFSFCGSVAPSLFGFPLSGVDVLRARAEFRRIRIPEETGPKFDEFTAQMRFSPSWLMQNQGLMMMGLPPFIPGYDNAEMGFSVQTPTITRPEIDLLFTNAPAFVEGRAQKVLENSIATFGYELSPFGIRLGNGEARIIFPALASHPLNPARSPAWESVRPTNVSTSTKLSRTDLLLLAAEKNLIADAFWRGRPGDLDDLLVGRTQLFNGQAIPAGLSNNLATQDLVRDYFPYGGVLAAGSVNFPNFIASAPPLDQLSAVFTPPGDPAQFSGWWANASNLLTNYITGTTEVGSAAIYLPAPNPPGLWALGTNNNPKNLDLLQALQLPSLDNILNPTNTQRTKLYAFNELLLQGYVAPKFFGLPVGRGRINLVDGRLEVTASADTDSWLAKLTPNGVAPGAAFDLKFMIDQPRYLAAKAGTRPTNSAAATAPSAADVFARITNEITPANASAKVAELLDTLPRTSFETKVAVDFPPELQQFLGASGNAQLNLYGFSFGFEPNYDPRGNTNSFPLPISTFDPVNPDPYTVARRQGGVGLAGQLNFTAPGFTLTNVAAALSLSAGQADNLFPRLKSQFTAESVALPGGFVFEQARVTFDSAPAVGGDIFRMGGLCSPINLAPFLVVRPPTSNLAQPIGANERLGGDLRVTKTGPNPNDVGTSLSLRPAQVYSPLLGVVGQISGANPADDFTFSSVPGTPWAARLELGGALLVRNPANMVINPTNPLSVTGDVLFQVELAGEGKLSATVEGVGLDEITMRVALPNGAKLTAFPGQKTEAKWVLGSDNTSCLLVKIKKDSTTGLPVLHQLYYDSGTVELNLAEAAVDTNGVRQPLMQVTGRVEFGIEPASLAAQLGNTPTSLTLPSTAVDRVSTNSFAVTNTGNAQLVLDASVTNNTTEFQVAPVRAVIPPGGATNFVVTFSPTAGGSRSAGLRLDAPRNATTRSVSLTGTATATASNNVTPSTLAFGEVERGRFLDRSVVVSNPGLAPLTVSNATVTAGRFSVVDTLPFTVPPRGQRTLLVRYEPNSAETSSNTLTVTTSAGNATVSLTGTGTQRLWYLQRRGERTLNAVAFALTNSTGNVFGMAVGNAGEVVVSSDSGRSWAPVDNLADATLHDVVLRGDVTTGRITSGWLVGENAVYQHNGVDNSWTRIPDFDSGGTKTILPAGVWRGAASRTNDGRVAIVGADASGRGLAGSSPAAPLTDRWPATNGPTASLFKPLNDVIETGGSFFAVGEDTEQLESTDGITWTRSSLGFQQSLPITTDFHAVARGTGTNAVWLIVGEEGLVLHRFNNEAAWTKLDFSSLTGARMLRGVTIDSNIATIVGEDGLILRLTLGTTSSNRASAAAEISEATRTLRAVATVSSQLPARFVAVGRGGEIHHRDSNLPGATLAAVQVPDSLVLNTGNSGLLFRTIEVRNPTASTSTYTLTAPSSLSLETNSVTLAPGEAQNVLVTYDASASGGSSGNITVSRGANTVATIPVEITEQSGMWQQVGWPAGNNDTNTVLLGFPSSGASTTVWLGTRGNAYFSTKSGSDGWTKVTLPTNTAVEAGHFAGQAYGVIGQKSAAALFVNDSTPFLATPSYSQQTIAMDSEILSGRLNGLALARSGTNAVLAAYSELDKKLNYNTNLSLPSTAASLVDVARRGAFHVMSTNRVFSRATNATSWTTNFTSSDTLSDLFALDASNIWAAGQNSTLYRLSAGNWAKQTAANIDGDFIAIAFSSTNQGFAILDRGDGRSIVSISTNAGASWADEFSLPTSLGRLTHVAVSPQSSNALVAGDKGQLWLRVAAATRTPNYAYAAAQVRFGSEAIGGRSTATLTVRNPGTQPYSITAADFADASSPFSYDFTNNITVPAGGTANLTVVYRPRTPGIHTDRLRLTTSAANGFIEVEVTGQAERRAATILVDTQPSGLAWRLGTNGTLARGPRVFEVVEGTPGANQVRIGDNLVVGTVASDTLASRNYRFREWRGSSDLVYSQPVTPAGGQVFARFERQLPTPPEHSVPAPVAATRCEDLVVPAGVGPGPWLRISDATLTLRGLDATERFRSEGALYLSLREAYGSLRTSAWNINAPEGGELLAATASSWRFLLRADRLELETETPGLRVLSRPLAPATHFVLTAAVGQNLGDSRIEGSFTLLDDANLLPGVVQFRSGSGVLFRLQTSLFEVRPYLRLDGTVRLLQTPFTDDGWLFESPYNLEVGNPAAISPTEEVTLVDVGLLKVVRDAQSRFQVGVNATNGAVGLQVGGLRTDFLGGATFRAPLASVDTSGRLEITMDSDLPLGPVYLDRTDSSASAKLVVDTRALGFSLSTPAMAVKPAVPVAYVDNQGESLWPETAWVLPAQSIDLLQDFEWRIDDEVMRNLRFGLWQFGEADRDSYLIAERKDGIFGLRFRSYSEAIFGDLDVRLRARMNGQLGGRAEGKLQAFGVEFGRGRIGFSPTRSTYQFSGTLSVLGLSATFDAGTTSSANTGGTFGARIR